MECVKYTIYQEDREYILLHCIYSFTKINIITVKGGGGGVAQVILNSDKTVLSYTHMNANKEIVLIYDYLRNRVIPALSTPIKYTLNQIHFRTAKHTFVANINEEVYHYSVKTGGNGFVGCVEIMIDKPSDRMKLPSLSQIYSEPECWYKSFHARNDIVDLIKGSLQLCQMMFGTSKFVLTDNSAIECGGDKNLSEKPPRKMKRSLSLAPLYVIKYGKTWYQQQFNAYMDTSNVKIVEAYNDGLKKLKSNIDLTFTDFIIINRLTIEQKDYLKPIYEKCYKKKSWFAFFNAIPDKKHCDAFFNWLPTFIDEYIMSGPNGTFYMNRVKWIIDLGEEGHLVKEVEKEKRAKITNIPNNIPEPVIDYEYTHEPTTMVRTDLYILTDPNDIEMWKGGNRKPRNITRCRNYNRMRNEWKILSFSNDILPTRR